MYFTTFYNNNSYCIFSVILTLILAVVPLVRNLEVWFIIFWFLYVSHFSNTISVYLIFTYSFNSFPYLYNYIWLLITPEIKWLIKTYDTVYKYFKLVAFNYSNLSFYASLWKYRTGLVAEVEVFESPWGNYWSMRYSFNNVVLLSDSQSATKAISLAFPPLSYEIFESRVYLWKLTLRKKLVVIQWIRRHCNVPGMRNLIFLQKRISKLFQSTVLAFCKVIY